MNYVPRDSTLEGGRGGCIYYTSMHAFISSTPLPRTSRRDNSLVALPSLPDISPEGTTVYVLYIARTAIPTGLWFCYLIVSTKLPSLRDLKPNHLNKEICHFKNQSDNQIIIASASLL